MKTINLDQASTSFPKAPKVGEAMQHFLDYEAVNISRGAYSMSYATAGRVFDCREHLAEFFHFPHPSHVVFSSGLTASINQILLGALKPGDEVICTEMDHNAVLRPCFSASQRGITWKTAKANKDGSVDPQAIFKLVTPQTRLIVMTMASNVCGTVLPWREVALFGKEHGIDIVLDSAQYAGLMPYDWQEHPVSAFVFSGHKGLGGPQGIGGALLNPEFAKTLEPVMCGGTGSFSHHLDMPTAMPDRFEPGTMNLPGIVGLAKALESLDRESMAKRYAKKTAYAKSFVEAARKFSNTRLCGTVENGSYDAEKQVPVISLRFSDDQGGIADRLEREFGIWTRSGLHCAPLAHQALGTFPEGTIRFSFPAELEENDIDYVVRAIQSCISDKE